jgi:outer membrane protein OmpA-like peptidoglycan-associated protein
MMQGASPVSVAMQTANFNPKHHIDYKWTSTGGQVTPNGTAASVDIAGLAPGSYTVTTTATDPQQKKANTVSCSATFIVKPVPPKNPPTISCTPNPASTQAGTPVTVTCNCTSPDNVPVSVENWTASAGSITGSGTTATLATAGVAPGPITVGATCRDSRGLTTQTTAAVIVEPAVNKELAARLALHSVYFPTAQPTEKNPNAGLVASQQKMLMDLATDFKQYLETQPSAHLTLLGHADVRGSVAYNQALSQRRVARVRSFLIENGIPVASLDTKAFGKERNMTSTEVRETVEQNPQLTPNERQRILSNMKTIIWASNRRVDIALNAPGQTETSVRQYPFNAADALTLIGGRDGSSSAAPIQKKHHRKPVKK